MTAERLVFIHNLMDRGAIGGLDFVPRIVSTLAGHRCLRNAGRLWELTTWLPGASMGPSPSAQHLHAACVALARLHRTWEDQPPAHGVCPAVERRIAVLHDWVALGTGGWQPPTDALDPAARAASAAWNVLRRRLSQCVAVLTPWLTRPVPLQPCLCDVWHDHVLFVGDRVTGLIDFGSCKLDHPAVDLARLFGSLATSDAAVRSAGIAGYEELRPPGPFERSLLDDLERTGVVVAGLTLLGWLFRDGRGWTLEERGRLADRLAGLANRLEGMAGL
jgi:Ser/Thr protein kinase RdoA (MazF antagonist)